MAESEVMTRSRFLMIAAVSMNGPDVSSKLPRITVTGTRSAEALSCSVPSPLCKLNS